MKKYYSLFISIALVFAVKGQTVINPGIFGLNSHLTRTVGIHTETGTDLFMDDFWNGGTYDYIHESHPQVMRYGGNTVEQYCLMDGDIYTSGTHAYKTRVDYVNKATIMRQAGYEPMLTVTVKAYLIPLNISQGATDAAALIKAVNDDLYAINPSYVVKYWIIGNEPEGTYGYDDVNAASEIYAYIHPYSQAIKTVWHANLAAWGVTDDDRKIVGPELYSYDDYNHSPQTALNHLVTQLTNNVNYPATYIVSDIDVFSFHIYPFQTESTYPSTAQ
jgi:hypothetical protein